MQENKRNIFLFTTLLFLFTLLLFLVTVLFFIFALRVSPPFEYILNIMAVGTVGGKEKCRNIPGTPSRRLETFSPL